VVTDTWWLPAALAPLFASHPLFVVENGSELESWCRVAMAQNVREVTFTSVHPPDDTPWTNVGARQLDTRRSAGFHVTRFELPPQDPASNSEQ
jgi:hypothetical protein